MNNILAACLLSSLIACTLDDPYMPVNPEEKPAPPVVTEYQPIALTVGANGHFDISGSSVKIGLNGKNSTYGVCLPQIAQGHFIAEVTADKTTNFGLAIVREKNGKPDFNNYTSVSVCTESGVSTVRVLDRQDGIDNVLDNTKKINKNDYSFRYSIPLNNSYFSVPFTASTGKARIIRNKISGFFHFYVSVGKEIDGEFHENWIELAQSKDWGGQGQNYFICPIVRNGNENSTEVNFSDIRFEEFSAEDVVESSPEFDVKQRNFTWAGFPGDAMVILSGVVLGPWWGLLAGGIGSAMADLLGGYFVYVPITFAIKGLVAVCAGLLYQKIGHTSKSRYAAVILGGIADIILVAGGYCFCEYFFLYGSGAFASVPANLIQGLGGLIISAVLYPILMAVPDVRQTANAVNE